MKDTGKKTNEPVTVEIEPPEEYSSHSLRHPLILCGGGALLTWVIVSAAIYFSCRMTGLIQEQKLSHATTAALLRHKVDDYLENPLRELRSLGLQLDIWVALPEEALQRSLRLASFRNPELTELLVADDEGRVLASFDPSSRLSRESHLTGLLDPHDSRRKLMQKMKRTVILVREKGDKATGILIAVPLFSNPGLRASGDKGFSDNASTRDTGEKSGHLTSYNEDFDGEPDEPPQEYPLNGSDVLNRNLRGYIAATLPLAPLTSFFKDLEIRPDILKITLSDRTGHVSDDRSSETPRSGDSNQEIVRLNVDINQRTVLPVVVVVPGFCSALLVFLLGFLVFFVEKRK